MPTELGEADRVHECFHSVAIRVDPEEELRLHALEHMHALLMEMRRNARSHGFPMLSYLLDMAIAEIKETTACASG